MLTHEDDEIGQSEEKPERRVKDGSKVTSEDIQRAVEAGNKIFEYYCEHGKLPEGVVK